MLLVHCGCPRHVSVSSQQLPTTHWLHGRFETLTGQVSARAAAVQILLPVAAVAIGFVLIALDLAFVQP